jgi:hypothetical protein
VVFIVKAYKHIYNHADRAPKIDKIVDRVNFTRMVKTMAGSRTCYRLHYFRQLLPHLISGHFTVFIISQISNHWISKTLMHVKNKIL